MDREFVGGRLCLDFANTVDWRTRAEPEELLHDYRGLVDWSRRAGGVSSAQARRLTTAARKDPASTAAAFARALTLREAVYRTLVAHVHGEAPPDHDLTLVVHSYADAIEKAKLRLDGLSYEWTFDEHAFDLERPRWPVAVSAVDLLSSHELSRVRECGGRGCGWLFLDESRSRTRRWCSAEGCGNRERVRRYYARTRQN